jgi:hypothetical protein
MQIKSRLEVVRSTFGEYGNRTVTVGRRLQQVWCIASGHLMRLHAPLDAPRVPLPSTCAFLIERELTGCSNLHALHKWQ